MTRRRLIVSASRNASDTLRGCRRFLGSCLDEAARTAKLAERRAVCKAIAEALCEPGRDEVLALHDRRYREMLDHDGCDDAHVFRSLTRA